MGFQDVVLFHGRILGMLLEFIATRYNNCNWFRCLWKEIRNALERFFQQLIGIMAQLALHVQIY